MLTKALIACLVMSGLWGCSDSEFGGGGSKAKSNTAAPNQKKPKPTREGSDEAPAPERETDLADATPVQPAPEEEVEEEREECTSKRRGKVRVVLVIDNSETVTSALPAIRDGAKLLVDALARLSTQADMPAYRFAAIKMDERGGDEAPVLGPGGWLEIQGGDGSQAAAEAEWAAQRGYDDTYDATFQLTESLLEADGASIQHANERNYVIIFGDGQHTDDALVPAIARNMAENLGVALRHFQVKGSPDAFYQQVALPEVGILDDSHKGAAYSSARGDQIQGAFDELGTAIAGLTFCR